MIDIHCHILAGLDDGAKTLEESVAMAKIAAASGTTDLVATPHANPRYHFDPELIEAKISELRGAVKGILQIHTGCDLHLSASNIENALAYPERYAINHRSYVLVEFSDLLIPPTAAEIFRRMRSVGMIPVITHPERNEFLQTHLGPIRAWVADDCAIQVTAQSFLGRFGPRAKSVADYLMENGLVHFVASDAHDAQDRTPNLRNAYRHVANTYGTEQAERVFVVNPKAVLVGEPLQKFEAEPKRKRKWRHFWGHATAGQL